MKTSRRRRLQAFILVGPLTLALGWLAVSWGLTGRAPLPTATLSSGTQDSLPTARISGGWFPSNDQSAGVVVMPNDKVHLPPFEIDRHEITNGQFFEFVDATGYMTTAEQTETGNVFSPTQNRWIATPNADWRHPRGPASSIAGKDDQPVVQVSFYDARAYARWAGKRLPNEAQWQRASRRAGETTGGANTFQGWYPLKNTKEDGYAHTCPVGSYSPNAHGLFDMLGNVREWCQPVVGTDGGQEPTAYRQAVLRGGSWLTAVAGRDLYDVRDTAELEWCDDTTGFRCVTDR